MLYGLTLDGFMFLVDFIPTNALFVRISFFFVGMAFCCAGVSLFFRTYISPEAYELFVKEVAGKFNIELHKFKIGFDFAFCVLSVVLSFLFFGLWQFEGINVGTVVSTFLNGLLIGFFTKLFGRFFTFEDRLPLRKYFEK